MNVYQPPLLTCIRLFKPIDCNVCYFTSCYKTRLIASSMLETSVPLWTPWTSLLQSDSKAVPLPWMTHKLFWHVLLQMIALHLVISSNKSPTSGPVALFAAEASKFTFTYIHSHPNCGTINTLNIFLINLYSAHFFSGERK